MESTFKNSIGIRVNKTSGFAEISIKVTDHKMEIYKFPIGDMNILLNQFREGMRSDNEEFNIETPNE